MLPKNWVHPGIQDLAEIEARTKALRENFSQELYDSFLDYKPRKEINMHIRNQRREKILKKRDEWLNRKKMNFKLRTDRYINNYLGVTKRNRQQSEMKFKRQLRKRNERSYVEKSDEEEEVSTFHDEPSFSETSSESNDPDWGSSSKPSKKPKRDSKAFKSRRFSSTYNFR